MNSNKYIEDIPSFNDLLEELKITKQEFSQNLDDLVQAFHNHVTNMTIEELNAPPTKECACQIGNILKEQGII